MSNKFENVFNFKKEELKKYYMLDRRPVILDEKKYINNIIDVFLSFFKFPYEINFNIAKIVFYDSKDINLKILNHLITNKERHKLNGFNLTNNSIYYIKYFLNKCFYNLLFYNCKSKIEISSVNIYYKTERYIKKYIKYLIIITNSFSNHHNIFLNNNFICNGYYNSDTYYTCHGGHNLLLNIIGNNQRIDKYCENEEIETSLNTDFFTGMNVEELLFYDYFENISNYNFNLTLSSYNNINTRTLNKILNIVNNSKVCEKNIQKYDNKLLNNEYVNMKDFSYLLMRYTWEGNVCIITIDRKYIIFGRNTIHDDCLNSVFFWNISIFNVKNNGLIDVPNYTIDDIKNMKRIDIYSFIKYDISILNN